MQKHCAKTGNPLYVFDTEDLVGNARTLLNMEQKYIVASMKADDSNRQTGSNSSRIEVAIGMKVMVTLNLATEADLANGTRGLIQDIVSAMVLFKPYKYQFDPFPGFAPGLIPIFPSEVAFNIRYIVQKQY